MRYGPSNGARAPDRARSVASVLHQWFRPATPSDLPSGRASPNKQTRAEKFDSPRSVGSKPVRLESGRRSPASPAGRSPRYSRFCPARFRLLFQISGCMTRNITVPITRPITNCTIAPSIPLTPSPPSLRCFSRARNKVRATLYRPASSSLRLDMPASTVTSAMSRTSMIWVALPKVS